MLGEFGNLIESKISGPFLNKKIKSPKIITGIKKFLYKSDPKLLQYTQYHLFHF